MKGRIGRKGLALIAVAALLLTSMVPLVATATESDPKKVNLSNKYALVPADLAGPGASYTQAAKNPTEWYYWGSVRVAIFGGLYWKVLTEAPDENTDISTGFVQTKGEPSLGDSVAHVGPGDYLCLTDTDPTTEKPGNWWFCTVHKVVARVSIVDNAGNPVENELPAVDEDGSPTALTARVQAVLASSEGENTTVSVENDLSDKVAYKWSGSGVEKAGAADSSDSNTFTTYTGAASPTNAPYEYTVAISYKDGDDTIPSEAFSEDSKLTATVTQTVKPRDFTIDASAKSIAQGGALTLTAKYLESNYNGNGTWSVRPPANATGANATLGLSDSNKSTNPVTLRVPNDAATGDYTISYTPESTDTCEAPKDVIVTVTTAVADATISIASANQSVTLPANDNASATITATIAGTTPLTEITATLKNGNTTIVGKGTAGASAKTVDLTISSDDVAKIVNLITGSNNSVTFTLASISSASGVDNLTIGTPDTITFTLPRLTVAMQPASPSIEAGNKLSLLAEVKNGDTVIAGKTISWKSSNTSIATVSSSGEALGIAPGEATITATCKIGNKEYSGSAQLTVTEKFSVTLNYASLSLPISVREKLTAGVTGVPDGATVSYAWTTNAEASVITVIPMSTEAEAMVSANNENAPAKVQVTVTATATIGGNVVGTTEATCDVTVVGEVAPIMMISGPSEVIAGDNIALTATVRRVSGASYVWENASNAVLPQDTSGSFDSDEKNLSLTLTQATEGIAKVTLKITPADGASPVTQEYSVTVKAAPVVSITTATAPTIKIGETATLEAAVANPVPGGKTVWSSDAQHIATVPQDTSGSGSTTVTVTGVGAGTAKVTAQYVYADKTVTSVPMTVTVEKADSTGDEFKISLTALELTVGDSSSLTVTGVPDGQTASWTSNETSVATVDSAGKVTAAGVGTAIITVTCQGVSATCRVTVRAAAVAPTPPAAAFEVTLPGTLQVAAGSNATLTATATNAATNATYAWSSSDSTIAAVSGSDKGIATISGVRAGSATITVSVTSNGTSKNATCVVTVTQAPVADQYTVAIGGLNSVTTGGTTTLSANITVPEGQELPSSATYDWSIVSGPNNISLAASGRTVVVRGTAAGNAVVAVSVSGLGQSAAISATKSITVTASDSASSTPSTTLRPGAPTDQPPAPSHNPGVVQPTSQPSSGASSTLPSEPSATSSSAPSKVPITSVPDAPVDFEVVDNPTVGGDVVQGINISVNTGVAVSIAELLTFSNLPAGSVMTVTTPEGAAVGWNTPTSTGQIVTVRDADGNIISQATVVVKGDVLGIGRINLSQLVRMADALRGTRPLNGAFLAAGQWTTSGSLGISLTDLVHEARLYRQTGMKLT